MVVIRITFHRRRKVNTPGGGGGGGGGKVKPEGGAGGPHWHIHYWMALLYYGVSTRHSRLAAGASGGSRLRGGFLRYARPDELTAHDPSNSGRWSDCYKCPSPQDVVKYSDLYIL